MNDVAMCVMQITQETIDGLAVQTIGDKEARDTYVAASTSVYELNEDLTYNDSTKNWSLISDEYG